MLRHSGRFIILLMGMALLPGQLSAAAPAEDKKPAGTEDSRINANNTANPPIECPLRKQGINPHELKPFAETQKYIDFLERSDRAVWQKPDAVIKELHVSGNEKIADIGAGSGYFTFRFARAVSKGTVYAIDIEPEMLRHIHHKAMAEGVRNIEVIRSTPADPAIPPGVDLVFVCDVLHHVKEPAAWLKTLSSQMKKGARLAVIEFREGDLPEGPPAAVKIPKKNLIAMITENNFKLETEKPEILPYQEFLIFTKP
jgi:2-polyprenyl-3-methyl-5-hydroxy-6-metoxy-1,4-benzoquinol methylase